MDKRTLANDLLQKFGRTLTVSDLKLDDEYNSCVLVFDEDLLLNFEFDEATGKIVLSAYLEEIPRQGCEPLLREMMGANLYWHKTKGGTLSLEDGTGGVILTYGHAVTDLEEVQFETIVENFVNRAYHWRNRITAALQSANAQSGAAPDDDPNMINISV